jgi:phospholipid N-methyltransferase
MGKSYSITETPTGAAGFSSVARRATPSFAGDAWHFLSTFARHPKTIGAVAPSSRRLAEAMAPALDLQSARVVVELGAGTGAITGLIRERIRLDATFLSVEMNPAAVDRLRRRFRGLHVICDSAENLRLHLDRLGHRHADCIVSSLPWSSMNADLQGRVLESIVASLRPGGCFSTMAYLHASGYASARHFRAEFGRHFGQITSSKVVWANLPPAFVYYGRKAGA